ncbi:putative cruciform cutting endonuclease [Cercophora samala]|uniref:Cruciform cutting endonuclease n=1 Tax=Cercophora samala TaxID=330535 RepID=A0AA39Z1Q5_9PEZI|nr:putative cruciform cutting endonuclease [Cercophora samala]
MTTTKPPLPGKITVAHLQSLCSSTGLPQAGPKSTIQKTLRQAAQSVQHIPDTARILSIDLGIKNFAFSLLTPAPSPSKKTPLPTPPDSPSTPQALLPPVTLHHWNHLDLTTPLFPQHDPSSSPIQFTPSSLSGLTYSLISTHLLPLKPTHVLIERQRFRTGNSSNIFEWTIRVNTLEAMLHACFATLKGVSLFEGNVISISPKTVAGYLFPKSETRAEEGGKTLNAYHLMKANKVGMLGEWLQQGKLIKPTEQGGVVKVTQKVKKGTGRKKDVVVKDEEGGEVGVDAVLEGGGEKKKSGRRKKTDGAQQDTDEGGILETPKKGRGRSKKAEVIIEEAEDIEAEPVKKRAGRRKKTSSAQEETAEDVVLEAGTEKKGRGRTRKTAVGGSDEVQVEEAETKPSRRKSERIKSNEVDIVLI